MSTFTTSATPWDTVRGLATQQNLVVGAAQLRQHGIDRSWVRREILARRMHRPLPEAYYIGPGIGAMTERAWLTAALHSCRMRGALYRETAIERLCGWKRGKPALHVVTVVGRAGHDHPTIRFHRTRALRASDVVTVDGDRTVAFTRTILDLAYVLSKHQLANVLHHAAYCGILDLLELSWLLEKQHGYPWTSVVRGAIELYRSGSAGTRSLSEDRFLDAWLRRDLPEPRVNDPSAFANLAIECDFVWPDRRLVVEVDGDRVHDRPNVTQKDAGRDAALAAAGWHVIRMSTASVWTDLEGCIESVRDAYTNTIT